MLVPEPRKVCDLSCGNGAVALALSTNPILGDFAPGYPIQGSVEDTLPTVPKDLYNLYICGETLEHFDNPDKIIGLVQSKYLLISTPIDCWKDTNKEHYWAWDRLEVESMVAAHGFNIRAYKEVDSRDYGESYCYGVWLFERED
jgi:hypothetical protein